MENDSNKIKIFIRIRPPLLREISNKSFIQCLNTKNNEIYVSKIDKPTILNTNMVINDIEKYKFDHVFDIKTDQIEIFQVLAKNLVENFLQGYNTTIFAYGQTGSGKTYTLEGTQQEPGIILHLINQIFLFLKDSNGEFDEKLTVSFTAIQIYLEKISDLLSKEEKLLKLKNTGEEYEISDVTEKFFDSLDESIIIFYEAQSKRIFANTNMNDTSSRGHVIYTIKLYKGKNLLSKFNIVDLAGSERISKSGTTGSNLKESISINKSLYSLQGVVDALVNPKSINYKNPSFRDSKLTMILKDSLGGNSITYLLANISPSLTEVSETISTLKFAQSCKQIINKPNKKEHTKSKLSELFTCMPETKVKKTVLEMPWKDHQPFYSYNSVITEYGEIFYLENEIRDFKDILLLLHASPSCAEEFKHWLPALSYYKYKVIAIDQPGYGRTKGKCNPCNSSFNLDKGGPCDIVLSVLKSLKIKSKVIVGGYDWGAGICLSLCSRNPNFFSKSIVFMPSYSEPTGNELKCLSIPVLVLWVELDQFHLWSKWKILAEKIPKKTIEVIKIKAYNRNKLGDCYCNISDLIMRPIVIFLGEADPLMDKEMLLEPIKKKLNDIKGNEIEAKININFQDEISKDINITLEKNKLTLEEICVIKFKETYKEIGSKIYEKYFNKDKEICEIFRGLPEISNEILKRNPSLLVQYGIWKNLPLNYEKMLNSPRYFKGRRVFILIPCSPEAKINGETNPKYLIYDPSIKDNYLSYSGVIKEYDIDSNQFLIEITGVDGKNYTLPFITSEIYLYNNGQEFYKNNLNELELEDGIRASYTNPIVKAKLLEICINISSIVQEMDFLKDNIENLQKLAIQEIRNNLNLISFYKGVIRERYGRTNCIGKLAINGQAQCHGLSSTISGYLYPLSYVLGIDMLYRGGYSFLTLNEDHVRVSNTIEKHQWLQVNLRPRMSSYIVDIWYQEQFENDKFLVMSLDESSKNVSYTHPKLLLKNKIILNEKSDIAI